MRHLMLLGLLVLTGCPSDPEPEIAEGIFAPLGEPLPSATAEQLATFELGREVAQRRFAPSDGLGPELNVTFCGACHEKPVPGGGAGHYRDFLLVGRELPDGSVAETGVNGVQPHYTLAEDNRRGTDNGTNLFASRNPIPFFGIGLLAEVPEEEILRHADPDDRDGDGVSGRPNFDRGFVGRFGRKSQTVSIEGFIRGPLFNHLGITSDPLNELEKAALPVPSVGETRVRRESLTSDIAGVGMHQAAAPDEPTIDADDVPDPELSSTDLFDLVSFAMLLAAPQPDEPTADTEDGRALFMQARCADCHVPALEGPRGLIPAFTDLLLHDMGEELADGIRMKDATGSEFRTQPLWGVSAVGPYLHDGRADTIDDAIRMHGGEGAASADAYRDLDELDRDKVVAFLVSLGGRAQRTEGLLPPGAPVPSAGEYGAALGSADPAVFERGRRVFDRDLGIASGLGPRFNGDACRACHFDPVIGGAGPTDVDVTRQAIIDSMGGFVAPAMGTMAHRHQNAVGRPPIDPMATFFELRQTPSVLGLGLVDRIADAELLANEDPDDLDGDGISGRAHVLTDGRVGRLGWKAGVPSLAEFARDAMFNELGVTLPDQPGLSFGGAVDDDDVADPEITVEDLDALVHFMSQLAPPPRTSSDPVAEQAGEMLFTSTGCAACHVPELRTSDGEAVPAYSDFLLHDVAAPAVLGIADGVATEREFRTAPLWGLATSAPYMHDGRSFTIEDAIAAHDAEASNARDAYMALSADDRSRLLAFLASL